MKDNERGSEIVQLVFALPILIVTFGLVAQMCLWIFGTVQFSQACELVADNVSISELNNAGVSSSKARMLIAQEISENMVGVQASEIDVSNVSITNKTDKYANGNSVSIGKALAPSSSDSNSYNLVQLESNGTLNFRAKYTCRNIVNVLGDHTLDFSLSRNRLLSRTTEVRENV